MHEAAQRWGDARKMLRLFRQAGELANDRGLERVTTDCIDDNLTGTECEATVAKLQQLPVRRLAVLAASVGARRADGSITQPVRTRRIVNRLNQPTTAERLQLGERAVQQLVGDLETMGLVNTWTESKGRGDRAMYIETTFDPKWVREAQAAVAESVVEDETACSFPRRSIMRAW